MLPQASQLAPSTPSPAIHSLMQTHPSHASIFIRRALPSIIQIQSTHLVIDALRSRHDALLRDGPFAIND
ncbi:hypothetical protein BC567DRAFT_223531 [Phyllosticta citribraziliensis]